MNLWYFKTFRIFDSPDKDVGHVTAVDDVFDTFRGNAIVKAHNEVVNRLEAEIERLQKDEVKTSIAQEFYEKTKNGKHTEYEVLLMILKVLIELENRVRSGKMTHEN